MNLDGSFFVVLSLSLRDEVIIEPFVDLIVVNRCRQVISPFIWVWNRNASCMDADHLIIKDNWASAVTSKWRQFVLDLSIKYCNNILPLLTCKINVIRHRLSKHDSEFAIKYFFGTWETCQSYAFDIIFNLFLQFLLA